MVSVAGVETTEYRTTTYDERLELIRKTIEFVDDGVPVVVGVSHPNVYKAIEISHYAEVLAHMDTSPRAIKTIWRPTNVR